MHIERRDHRPLRLVLAAPVVAIVSALILAGGLIALAGANPLQSYVLILKGALGSMLGVTETLTRAIPLILTGLAVAVAFRSRLWNIGGEGQFYAGALAVAALAMMPVLERLPGVVAIPLCLLAGALAGMALMLVALGLRLQFGVDEVVTSLLLNFIALLVVSMLIDGPMRDPMSFGWPQSMPVPPNVELPKLLDRGRLHWGLLIAIGLVLVVWLLQARTVFGLQSRAAGFNPQAARFAGVSLDWTLIKVACLSGGLAGLAGAVEVLGVKGYVTTDLSPGYGYAGIVVAMLANLSPVGVIFAALFSAVMFVGADSMSRALSIPSYIADVTVSLSLLTMLVAVFFTQYRIKLK